MCITKKKIKLLININNKSLEYDSINYHDDNDLKINTGSYLSGLLESYNYFITHTDYSIESIIKRFETRIMNFPQTKNREKLQAIKDSLKIYLK